MREREKEYLSAFPVGKWNPYSEKVVLDLVFLSHVHLW